MSSLEQMMRGLRVEKDGQPAAYIHGKEILIPAHFTCPISLELMKDPVILSSGITYDRNYIEKWLQAGNCTCPVTNQVLENLDLIPNRILKKMIEEWCPMEISEILARIQASSSCLDQYKVLESVRMMEKFCMESECNRLCIIDNKTAIVLAVAFVMFANDSFENNSMVLKEILPALTWMFPLGKEGKKILGSQESLRCMVWFLNSSDEPVKKSAVLALQELSSEENVIEALGSMEDVHQNLSELIKDKKCPKITRAALKVTRNLVSFSSCKHTIGTKFVEMGLINTLLDIILDCDKSLCEKGLGVLDELCDNQKGMQEAYKNDLTMPVLMNKLLRSSALATDYSLSVVLKLLENDEEIGEVKATVEALQFGVFQKLVLLLQINFSGKTKEKITKLLKLLNPIRPGIECIDPMDFKNLERSF